MDNDGRKESSVQTTTGGQANTQCELLVDISSVKETHSVSCLWTYRVCTLDMCLAQFCQNKGVYMGRHVQWPIHWLSITQVKRREENFGREKVKGFEILGVTPFICFSFLILNAFREKEELGAVCPPRGKSRKLKFNSRWNLILPLKYFFWREEKEEKKTNRNKLIRQ